MKDYVESVFNKKFERKYYKKFMKITPKGKILDLGCGVGSASNIFIEAGYNYIGYDIDEYYISLGKKYNPNLNINVGNMIDIPNQEPKANGVVYAYSLINLSTEEVKKSFKSCYNNMIEGGNILIFTRYKDFDAKPNFYVNIIHCNELASILKECGFNVVYTKKLDDISVCIIATKQKRRV